MVAENHDSFGQAIVKKMIAEIAWRSRRARPACAAVERDRRCSPSPSSKRSLPIVRAAMPPTPQYAWPLLKAAHRRRCRGQAREPHADRRLQGARRARLCRAPQARAQPHVKGIVTATRGNHGQSLRVRLRARRHRLHGGGAVRQFDREERRHAGVRRRADRARPRLRRGARARRGDRRRSAATSTANRSTRTWCSASRPTRYELFTAEPDLDAVLRADRARLRHLRRDRRARRARATRRRCSA